VDSDYRWFYQFGVARRIRQAFEKPLDLAADPFERSEDPGCLFFVSRLVGVFLVYTSSNLIAPIYR
jgi:hypothetical protein